MRDLHENLMRGTEDLPFSRYDFAIKKENFIITQTQWHSELEILTIKCGKINLLLEGDSHILESGDIAFINPNEYHAVKILDFNTVYTAFVFSRELITFPPQHFFEVQFTSKIFNNKNKLPNIIRPSHPLYKSIAMPIEKIRDECHSADPEILYLLIECFTVFIKNNALIKSSKNKTGLPTFVKESVDYISSNYNQNITLSQLSNLAHLSPNYFCSAFKAATGLTPIEQLQIIRIEKAATLLLSSDYSLEEISNLCGFQNVGYFIRLFKRQKSLTPHAFRKKMSL